MGLFARFRKKARLFILGERPALPPQPLSVSEELEYLYEGDQGERNEKFEVSDINQNDTARLNRVVKLLQEFGLPPKKQFPNLKDYSHAAMILHHSSLIRTNPASYNKPAFCRAANKLVKFAMDKGLTDYATKRLYAESFDRALMLEGKLQKYGTQFKDGVNLWPVDPKTSDEERALYGVQPLKFLEIGREIKYFQSDVKEFFESLQKALSAKIAHPDSVKTKCVEVLEKIKSFKEKFSSFPQEVKNQPLIFFISDFLSKVEQSTGEQLNNRNNVELLKTVLFAKEKKLYDDIFVQLKSFT